MGTLIIYDRTRLRPQGRAWAEYSARISWTFNGSLFSNMRTLIMGGRTTLRRREAGVSKNIKFGSAESSMCHYFQDEQQPIESSNYKAKHRHILNTICMWQSPSCSEKYHLFRRGNGRFADYYNFITRMRKLCVSRALWLVVHLWETSSNPVPTNC